MKTNCEFNLLLLKIKESIGKPFNRGTSINLKGAILFLNENCLYSQASHGEHHLILTGQLYNRAFLASLAGLWDSQACLLNDAELMLTLSNRLGQNAFGLAEGNFCIIFESDTSPIKVITEQHGFNAVHMVNARYTWVTNSLKSVTAAEGAGALRFASEEQVISSTDRQDTFSAVLNARRLKPGSLYTLGTDSQGFELTDIQSLVCSPSPLTLNIQRTTLMDLIDHHLNSSLDDISQTSTCVGIPLSGGLDSSLISALAVGQFVQVKTFSIGTASSNEFEYAQLVADSLGTHHQTRVLSEEDVVTGIIESIFHNEIFDGLSAEIQSGLFNVYRMAQGQVSTLLTGYGSDLLFGGILTPGKHYIDPNKLLAGQVYRTRWTGEFSTNGASHYGIDVRHPFWTQSLITLCHRLNPHHKTRNNEVKNILREYAAAFTALPDSIVWRKKIGIHEGSAVNRTFADILGADSSDYARKNLFSYRAYKTMLSNEYSLQELTHDRLRHMMQEKMQ